MNTTYASINRREFIRGLGGCAALSSVSVLSTLLNLRLTASALAQQPPPNDHKALVCLFLFGGNDSFNMLTPYDATEHAGYATIRGGLFTEQTDPGLALPRVDDMATDDPNVGMALKPVTASSQGGRRFGLHGFFNAGKNANIVPGDDYMRQLYNNGELAFVSNVGSLIRPVTKANWSSFQPVGLFSHSDEVRNWQTSLPQTAAQNVGVAGRIADALTDSVNQNATISMNVALNSLNTFQTGRQTQPYIVSSTGATLLTGYGSTTAGNRILTQATNSLLSTQYANLLDLTYGGARRDSIDAAAAYNTATANVTLLTDTPQNPWPTYSLATQLRQVARAIVANADLGQRRQIFFVNRGGFDNHDVIVQGNGGHTYSLPEVGEAVWRFTEEIRQQGLLDEVTLFTASDFARTLGANSNFGSDHAWGANQFVVGGSQVRGGDVHGIYPNMTNPADFGSQGQFSTDSRGRLIPSHSVDEYMLELARWFGVSDSDMDVVLPNLVNFAGRPAIGFMS